MLIRGNKLTSEQVKLVLNAFIYRWTTGNTRRNEVYRNFKPECLPSMPLQTDEEWLMEHSFHFTKDGERLMANRRHAEPAFLADAEECA